MADVVGFRPGLATPPGEANPHVIEVLELALARAKRGEMTAVALCWVEPSRKMDTDWSRGLGRHALIAGAVYLQHDLVKAQASDE